MKYTCLFVQRFLFSLLVLLSVSGAYAQDSYTAQRAFPAPGREAGIAFSIGAKAYVGMGWIITSYYNDFWEWDQATNTWTQKTAFPTAGREGMVSFAIGTKGYAGMGQGAGAVYNRDLYEYDPATNAWTAKASLASGGERSYAVSFVMGGLGYVGTGENGSAYRRDFWKYNPATNTWAAGVDLPGLTYRGYAMTFTIGSKAFVAGGSDNVSLFKDLWEFNGTTWTARADMPVARHSGIGFAVCNTGYVGTGVVASSTISKDMWAYNGDPASTGYNTWNKRNDMPAECHLSSTFQIGNDAYIATGHSTDFLQTLLKYNPFKFLVHYPLNSVYVTDAPVVLSGGIPAGGTYTGTGVTNNIFYPATAGAGLFNITYTFGCLSTPLTIRVNPCTSQSGDTWASKATYTSTSVTRECSFSIGAKGYVMTGRTTGSVSTAVFWVWDQAANTWTQLTDFTGTARHNATAFAIGTKGYIGTGYASTTGAYLNDFWEWDQASNTWTRQNDFPGDGRENAVGFSIGTKGYIGTGDAVVSGTNTLYTDFYEWNQSNNVWTRKTDFPGTARYSAVGYTIGTKGYITSGRTSMTSVTAVLDQWEWDQPTDTWTSKASIPEASGRYDATAFTVGAKAYIGGGVYTGSGSATTFFEWDQASNIWTARATKSGLGRPSFTINGKGYSKGSAAAFFEYTPLTCAPAVVTNSLAGINFCAGNVVLIPYTALGTFTSGNVFTAELSNSSGSFASPVNLGTVTSTTSGTIAALIPSGTAYGTGYRIRVNASAPSTTGTDNGADLVIFPTGGVTLTAFSAVYESTAPFALTGGSPTGGTYSGSGVTSGTFDPSSVGPGTYTITYSNGCYSAQKTITVFGCADGSWTQKADYPGLTGGLEVGFSIGTKGYIVTGLAQGGGSGTKVFWEWNQATNVWTQLTDFPGEARLGAIGFSIGTKGYVGLGYGITNTYKNDFWEWNQSTNTWLQKGNFPGDLRAYAEGFSIGTKGYLGMGAGPTTSFMKDFWEWDQATDTWTRKADLPAAGRWNAFGFPLNNKAYIGGGTGASATLYDYWEWNVTTNAWTKKNDLPGEPTFSPLGFSIGSKAYVSGNSYVSSSVATYNFWEWNALTDSWTLKAPYPGWQSPLASNMPVFTINGKGYIKVGTALAEYFPDCQPFAISVMDISGLTFCLGGPATNVSYTALGTYTAGNVFTAQLSNASGSFASPTNVGSVTSVTSGGINITLPANLPAGANYRLRIVSSTPVVTGVSNSTSLVINPTVTFGTLNTVYSTDPAFTLTQGSPSGGTYSGTGVSNGVFTPATAGVGTFTITYTYGCKSVTRTIRVVGCTSSDWRRVTDYPGGTQYGESGFTISNDAYMLAGRQTGTGTPTKGFWKWNQISGVWTQLSDFSGSQRYAAAGFAIGMKGYIGLGSNGSTSLVDLWEWDQPSNSWLQKANAPSAATNTVCYQTFIIASKAYFLLCKSTPLAKELWEWSQATDSWTRKADLPGSSRWYPSAFASGTKGYIVGGIELGGTSTVLQDVWEWNQTTNTWLQKNNFGGGARLSTYNFAIGGYQYVGGGNNNVTTSPDFWRYDFATDTWLLISSNTSTGVNNGDATFSINGKGYKKGNNTLFYEYYPSCDPVITVNDLSGYTFCATGTTMNIPYSALGRFFTSNIFTAQLSNASGSFASPVNIGTVGASTSGLISITIPAGTPAGTGYRIRVNSSAPAVTGLDNGVNLIIAAAVTNSITTTYPAMRIDDPYIVLTGGTPSGGVYSGDGVANGTFDPALAGPGIHTITYTYGCGQPATTFIEVKQCGESVWTKKENYTGTQYSATSGFSIGNKAYLVGGNSTNEFWSWDQPSNTWTQLSNFPGAARFGAVSFTIGNKGYVGTGALYPSSPSTYTNQFWEWNQANNTWVQKSNFPGAGRQYATGFSIGNKGYITTGVNWSVTNDVKTDLWEWNQTTNGWTQKTNFPGVGRFLCYSFTIGTKAYVGNGVPGGGSYFGGVYYDMYEWDQVTGLWTQKADMPNQASSDMASTTAFAIGNQGIVVGRDEIGGGGTYTYIWNQADNTWSFKSRSTNLYNTIYGFSSNVVINGKGYVKNDGVGNGSWLEYGCPPSLHVVDIAQKTLCSGTSVSLSFSQLGGPLNSNNTYIIEFSDPDGVFRSSPYYATSAVSGATLSSPLSFTMPNISGGDNSAVFRIRLRSTSPALVSEPSSYLVYPKFTHPAVTLASFSSVNTATPPFALTGGTPAGGVYSGPGVSGGIFDPSVAGAGTKTITYTYNSCSTPATNTIVVTLCGGCDVARPSGGDISEVKFYPNPFDDKVKVFVNEVDNGSTAAVVHLLNLQGEEVHREDIMTNEEKEFLVNVPSGMYMINITVGDKVVGRYKLMKGN
jgi:N-acetylneuraminic acid mutarotase